MKDYKYIRAWGKKIGASNNYIEDQVARARIDGAPPDAVYAMDEVEEPRSWVAFGDLAKDTQLSITYYLGYYGDGSDYPLGEPNPPFRERDARDRD